MFHLHSYINLIDQKVLEPAMLLLKIIVIAENTPYRNTQNIYEYEYLKRFGVHEC